MSDKPRLGVDIDGVVCEFFKAYDDWVTSCYKFKRVPCDRYDWYLNYPHGARLWSAAHSEGIAEVLYGGAPVTPGAAETLAELSESWDIHFLTYRPARLAQITSKWLDKNGMPYPLTHTDFKYEVPCDLYVDDHADTVRVLLGHGRKALLFRREWNREAWELPGVWSWSALRRKLGAVA